MMKVATRETVITSLSVAEVVSAMKLASEAPPKISAATTSSFVVFRLPIPTLVRKMPLRPHTKHVYL